MNKEERRQRIIDKEEEIIRIKMKGKGELRKRKERRYIKEEERREKEEELKEEAVNGRQ